MPHTQSRYQQDLGFNDARLRANPSQEIIPFGTTVLTRTAAGNVNYAQAATQTVNYACNVTSLLIRRLGFPEDLQEAFGGSGIPGSAQFQGRPDTIPSMATGQQITPRTALKVKGHKLLSFDVIYQINAVNLVAHTCQVNQTVYTAGQASPTITNVLASAANGLTTAFGPNLQVVNVPLAAPAYIISPDADMWIEVNAQTPAGGTYTLWGFDVSLEFNYN